MKKVIIISMTLILSFLLLWNSGDRKITTEELTMIDPLWRSPDGIELNDANYQENTGHEKMVEGRYSLQIKDNKEEIQNVSLITNSLKPGISSKTGRVDYNF
jgi:hypothetical protein